MEWGKYVDHANHEVSVLGQKYAWFKAQIKKKYKPCKKGSNRPPLRGHLLEPLYCISNRFMFIYYYDRRSISSSFVLYHFLIMITSNTKAAIRSIVTANVI